LPAEPLDLAWSPDGERILAACADGQLRVVDWETIAVTREQAALTGWAYTVVATPDADMALVGGTGGQLKAVPFR